MRVARVLFFAALLLGSAVTSYGQRRISVHLVVHADGDDLYDQLVSFIGRELRSLGDVDIVPDDHPSDFDFEVVAVGSKSYAFGLAAASTRLTCPCLNVNCTNELVHVDVATGRMDELRKSTENLVAAFDAQVLNSVRQRK